MSEKCGRHCEINWLGGPNYHCPCAMCHNEITGLKEQEVTESE